MAPEAEAEAESPAVIHAWSAPRSLSTSLMYSFAQRDDMEVLDEPLYANFLRATGVDRPYRQELLSKMILKDEKNMPKDVVKTEVFYVAIIGVTYYIIVQTSFEYIPGYYVSGLHRYLSVVAVAVGAILFVLTSFSDPGAVTAENVSQYVSSYPYDNVIFVEKECSTCKITRPARAKHCRICDKCVARFDHHCGWMNNCIGEKNTRYFVAFLIWHFLICLYGAIILGFVLAGELKERKIVYILTVYYGIDNSFSGLFPHVAQWLLSVHNTQILLSVFLAILALLLGGFCAYHLHLCLINTTTNETFKWQDYIMWMKKENEAKAAAAALKSSIGSANSDAQKAPPSKWRAFFMRSRTPSVEPVVKNNIYDRGMIKNLCEVVVPLSEQKSFSRRKSD